jgi:sulfatase modifying factor 1
MKIAFAYALVIAILSPIAAFAITIDTVPVGNPGNPNDFNNGIFGKVTTSYRIATTEITNSQYVSFLNAVAASDPLALYNANMDVYSQAGIHRSGSSGSYTYSVKPDVAGQGINGADYTYGDKPVVFVSWYDAIRFDNWVNNGATAGASTETGAYTILGGSAVPSNGNTIARNSGAIWFLPTENQWYKAAYYDGTATAYYDYPTKSNSAPDNNLPPNDTGNSANYLVGHVATDNVSYPMTGVGTYLLSKSAYGTSDQGGNVWEWDETSTTSGTRVRRGGAWSTDATTLNASHREEISPTTENEYLGFRLAAIPSLPGDYNVNGVVDAADYVLWRKYLNQSVILPNDTTPGTVTSADFDVWRAHFGQTPASGSEAGSLLQNAVPEPTTSLLLLAAACFPIFRRSRS